VLDGVHSFGRELRTWAFDGIRVSETLMTAGLLLGEHSHDAGQICFVLEGEYRERTGGRDHELYPGMLQVRAPGATHSNVFSPADDTLTLLVSLDRARWIRVQKVRPLHPSSLLTALGREIREELRRADDLARISIESLVILTATRVSRLVDIDLEREPEWLGEAMAMIARRFAEPLSLVVIANHVGVHRATLAAATRRWRGVSVGAAIREARVRYAAETLIATKMSLAEIACTGGFYDQSHFGRVFRRATGLTPVAYRRLRR
jgi:AraC family transcriptional regulator